MQVYSQIFRTLKPGAIFATYEWCLTEKWDGSSKHKCRVPSTRPGGARRDEESFRIGHAGGSKRRSKRAMHCLTWPSLGRHAAPLHGACSVAHACERACRRTVTTHLSTLLPSPAQLHVFLIVRGPRGGQVADAMRAAGFELVHERDAALDANQARPLRTKHTIIIIHLIIILPQPESTSQ